jgi:hypothetical protein
MLSAIRPIKLFLTIQHGLRVVAAQTVVARAGTKPRRRFPPPWTIEELNDACFPVSDANGQKLAYVYFEDEPGRRAAAKLLTKDEARRIAANVAKLPELLLHKPPK